MPPIAARRSIISLCYDLLRLKRGLMARDSFVVFGAPQILPVDVEEVLDCLRSGWVGTGPRAAQFEADFHRYKDSWGYPVAVSSGTAALHVALLAAGLDRGDEVITTPLTFCATVNAILHADLTPVLADVESSSMNIDSAAVERAITPRTRALLPVHFTGRPCEMNSLREIANRHGLVIIEDCAHAIEATYHGEPAGTMGDFGCFSFYVTKNVTTAEGGLVLARDPARADRVRTLSLHGLTRDAWTRYSDEGFKHYQVVECGFKYNMTDLAAALGLHQLARIEQNWCRRQAIWTRYLAELAGLPLALPAPPAPGTRHALHLFTVRIEPSSSGLSRDDFVAAMTARRIGVGVHYLSIPEHPYYASRFGWRPDAYPPAMAIGRETVSLPLSPALSDSDVTDVITAVREILR